MKVNLETILDRSIKLALDGEALLFVGAGVSSFNFNKNNLIEQYGWSGGELKSKFNKEYGFNETLNLNQMCSAFVKKYGNKKFNEYLCQHYLYKNELIIPEIKELFAVDWKFILTTNIDNLIELSKPNYDSISFYEDVSKINATKKQILHLNGKLTNEYDEMQIRMCREDYLKDIFVNKWRSHLLNLYADAKAIIFLGYSFYDDDVAKIFYKDIELKNKTLIIDLDDDIDNDSYKPNAEYGNLCSIGIENFINKIKTIKATYIPHSHTPEQYFVVKQEFENLNKNHTELDSVVIRN